ncbi:trypsin II-P29 [Patella vulgata]|uniref:trypsin II-P29 n=1 Tax=Patella vulgata TaxID=6465 RepID=UPI00217F9042|nr:trypsin II-P29 [Patella vulgata]
MYYKTCTKQNKDSNVPLICETPTNAIIIYYSVSRFLVILGDYRTNRKERTEQLFKLRRVYVHPRYNRRRVTNDLAILKLAGKVRYTKTVKRVRLAKPGQNFVGSTCIISGWGATRGGGPTSNILQFTRVTVITSRRCQRSYDDIFGRVICFLSNDRGSGICDGDSGGPAVCHGVLAGVTSFGVDDCLTHYPSVYTRVSYYNKYIRQRL